MISPQKADWHAKDEVFDVSNWLGNSLICLYGDESSPTKSPTLWLNNVTIDKGNNIPKQKGLVDASVAELYDLQTDENFPINS